MAEWDNVWLGLVAHEVCFRIYSSVLASISRSQGQIYENNMHF